MMQTTIEQPSSPRAEDDLGIEPVVESSVQFAVNPASSLIAAPFPNLSPAEFVAPLDSEPEPEPEVGTDEEPEAEEVEPDTLSAEPIIWESASERDGSEQALGHLEFEKVRIPEKTFFKIGEVAEILKLKPYVLRYWETEFPFAAPEKKASGQRVYRRAEVETLVMIKHLLYHERYSIEGARKRIKELRKEGDLRKFKKDTVAENVVQEVLTAEKKKKVSEGIQQLRELMKKSAADFFRW